ncbi:hypothetical protein LTR50_000056 [Elasticomyces elasticus]|nr:hypothetical protein LTR50_000056 [Elasticomyces elasticus]
MPIPMQTSSSPTEKPSTSETAENTVPQDSQKSANVSDQDSSMGATGQPKGDAEKAAEKLYEERIEDEYAKREGGA